jgi:hypothetical protein
MLSIVKRRNLRVFVGTWNLHGALPEGDISAWLGSPSSSSAAASSTTPPDVYVIGTQEATRGIEASILSPSKARWRALLESALGDGYTCIGSQTLVAIHLAVFVRVPLLPLVSSVQTAHVSTGAMNIGNKGAAAVALSVGRTSFLFVNAHLAAHQERLEQRNADFHRIEALLPLWPSPRDSPRDAESASARPAAAAAAAAAQDPGEQETAAAGSSGLPPPAPTAAAVSALATALPPLAVQPQANGESAAKVEQPTPSSPASPSTASTASTASARFDRVFWLGDLNYRINGNREVVDSLLAPADERTRAQPEWEGEAAHWDAMRAVLLANDQLRLQHKAGAAFAGFVEGDLTFRPTYKFDKAQPNVYDMSEKRRIPAYTDRVLWRPAPAGWPAAQPVPLMLHAASNGESMPEVQLRRYDSVPSLCISDHKPVLAEFDVAFDPADGRHSPAFRPPHRIARQGTSVAMGSSSDRVGAATPRRVVRQTSGGGGSASQSSVCSVM